MRKINLLFLFVTFFTVAQESVFYTVDDAQSFTIPKFGLAVYSHSFIKNNEYFNYIADGFTLLGTQFQPEFIYNSSKNTQFKIGAFVQKNFGTDKIASIIPTFTFTYKKNNHQFVIGNLDGRNNHQFIEPLFASEEILSNQVLETGFQYKFNSKSFALDAWLDWENSIVKNDEEREVFVLGTYAAYKLVDTKKHQFTIPLQFMYYHKGGQINNRYLYSNTDNILVLNFTNIGIGPNYSYNYNEQSNFRFRYYFLNHANNNIDDFPFKNGTAHFIDVTYTDSNFIANLGYFASNRFISPKGNEMFQSYSLKANNTYYDDVLDNRYVGHTEQDRNLLFAKLMYQKQLTNTIKLGVQLESFYQLNDATLTTLPFLPNTKNTFDYSYAVYVILNDIFKF